MFELFLLMIERLGIIVMLAFLLTRLPFFRELIFLKRLSRKQKWLAILFFGLFSVIGTYSGFNFSIDTFNIASWDFSVASGEAIVNFRVIGVVIAGLLGGYRVGVGTGLIAGIHRLALGGYTGLSCGIATIIAGFFAGYFSNKDSKLSLRKVFIITASAETMQMGLILLLSRPLDKVIPLVQNIGPPMIIANGLGAVIFMVIIRNVFSSEEKLGATHTQLTLRVADQTLVYLREGLNEASATNVCKILYDEVQPFAVAITDENKILAHMGAGSDHHKKGEPIQTQVTKETIANANNDVIIASEQDICCNKKECPLRAVIIVPLKLQEKQIGTIKFYYQSKEEISLSIKELITGLSILLNNQLEIAEAERALALAKEAEINALQAQIRPHFLFNTLSAISSLIRIDPKKARKLLLSLSHFLRENVSSTTIKETTIDNELAHVKAYLTIEETRFSDRLKVDYDISASVLQEKIPPLTLQPILENAIKHGLKNKQQNGRLKLQIKNDNNHIYFSVTDNGEGIPEEKLAKIGEQVMRSDTTTGMALFNINRRLAIQFGQQSKLSIRSKVNEGTEVSFIIPKVK